MDSLPVSLSSDAMAYITDVLQQGEKPEITAMLPVLFNCYGLEVGNQRYSFEISPRPFCMVGYLPPEEVEDYIKVELPDGRAIWVDTSLRGTRITLGRVGNENVGTRQVLLFDKYT